MQLCCLQTWYRFTDIASAEFRHSPLCCCQNTNFVLLFLHLQSSKGTIEIHYLLLLFVLICSRFFIIIIIIIIIIISIIKCLLYIPLTYLEVEEIYSNNGI